MRWHILRLNGFRKQNRAEPTAGCASILFQPLVQMALVSTGLKLSEKILRL
jgi:hypothetical protein